MKYNKFRRSFHIHKNFVLNIFWCVLSVCANNSLGAGVVRIDWIYIYVIRCRLYCLQCLWSAACWLLLVQVSKLKLNAWNRGPIEPHTNTFRICSLCTIHAFSSSSSSTCRDLLWYNNTSNKNEKPEEKTILQSHIIKLAALAWAKGTDSMRKIYAHIVLSRGVSLILILYIILLCILIGVPSPHLLYFVFTLMQSQFFLKIIYDVLIGSNFFKMLRADVFVVVAVGIFSVSFFLFSVSIFSMVFVHSVYIKLILLLFEFFFFHFSRRYFCCWWNLTIKIEIKAKNIHVMFRVPRAFFYALMFIQLTFKVFCFV